MEKIIGIYKITNPKGKIYIGQSENINFRFITYKRLKCKSQIKLYNSLKYYGVLNHTFEIIEECEVNMLNERERYWQEYYDVLGDKGLNLVLVSSKDKKMVMSESVKSKIGIGNKGKIIPEHVKLKMARKGEENGMFGVCRYGDKNPMFGKKHSDETKAKIGLKSKERTGYRNAMSKMVFNEVTGIFYDSANEACFAHGFSKPAIFTSWLRGVSRNRSDFYFVSNNENKVIKHDTNHIIDRKSPLSKHNSKKILNTETGIYYDSISQASIAHNIKNATLSWRLKNNFSNTFIYV